MIVTIPTHEPVPVVLVTDWWCAAWRWTALLVLLPSVMGLCLCPWIRLLRERNGVLRGRVVCSLAPDIFVRYEAYNSAGITYTITRIPDSSLFRAPGAEISENPRYVCHFFFISS
jgi:hypothetical protein